MGAAAIVAEETDAAYIEHGAAGARVTGGAGDYLEADAITLEAGGYVSVWTALRVIAGGVRLTLIDANNVVYPMGAQAVAGADIVTRGLAVAGLSLPTGDYRVRVTCTATDSDFVLDAWTLTASATAQEYRPDMGPRALWRTAGVLLAAEGGALPARIDAGWYDFSAVDSSLDPPKIGGAVRVRDSGIDTTARIVELTRYHAGRVELVRGRIGSRARDFIGLLTPSGRRAAGPVIQPAPATRTAVEVSVSDGRSQPVIRMVYPAGLAALRIEAPIPAMSDTEFDELGSHGEPPAPITDGRTDVGVATLDMLDAGGGEISYEVGIAEFDGGTDTEDALAAGSRRGEYRVFALPDGSADSRNWCGRGCFTGRPQRSRRSRSTPWRRMRYNSHWD